MANAINARMGLITRAFEKMAEPVGFEAESSRIRKLFSPRSEAIRNRPAKENANA